MDNSLRPTVASVAPGLRHAGLRPTCETEITIASDSFERCDGNVDSWWDRMKKASLLAIGGLGVATGLAGCGEAPPKPKAETSQVQQQAAAAAVVEEPHFSEGRELLVDLSHRAENPEFLPDPAQQVDFRGRPIFAEDYISSLVDRDLTGSEIQGPRFTSVGADESQISKIYFDRHMEEAGFGRFARSHDGFATRLSRHPDGGGITDRITQHHLSCIYRLEADAEIGGVQLEGGKLYRVTSMDPSNYTMREMDKAVCPGNRLVRPKGGTQWDIEVVQQNDQGEQLYVNPADILQVWTLTEAEAARYGG